MTEADQITITLICTDRKRHAPSPVVPLVLSGGHWLPEWVRSGSIPADQRSWPTVMSAEKAMSPNVTVDDIGRRPARRSRDPRRRKEGHTFESIMRSTIPNIVEAKAWILRCPQCERRPRISRRQIDELCNRVIERGGSEADLSYRPD
jgi:hypothetical protein